MGNLCTKHDSNVQTNVELKASSQVHNPVQGSDRNSNGANKKTSSDVPNKSPKNSNDSVSSKNHTSSVQSTAPQSPKQSKPSVPLPSADSPVISTQAERPPSVSRPASDPRPPATTTDSPASPNKKKLSDLLQAEKNKRGDRKGTTAPVRYYFVTFYMFTYNL